MHINELYLYTHTHIHTYTWHGGADIVKFEHLGILCTILVPFWCEKKKSRFLKITLKINVKIQCIFKSL